MRYYQIVFQSQYINVAFLFSICSSTFGITIFLTIEVSYYFLWYIFCSCGIMVWIVMSPTSFYVKYLVASWWDLEK